MRVRVARQNHRPARIMVRFSSTGGHRVAAVDPPPPAPICRRHNWEICAEAAPPTRPVLDPRPPSGFHHVGALEQRRVTDHAIVEQNLVAGVGVRAEILGVFEAHIHRPHAQHRPGNFGAKAQRDSFHRLDLDDQRVGVQLVKRRVAE